MLKRLNIVGLVAIAAMAPASAQGDALLAAADGRSRPLAAAAACPFQIDSPTVIAAKRDLPPEVIRIVGEMADKGEPFQESDALPAGPHPPWSRFVSAQGQGCDLNVEYEHGGRGHYRARELVRFDAGHWTKVGP